MTRSEVETILINNGFTPHVSKWYVYSKIIGDKRWVASIGSVPILPLNEPFACNIWLSPSSDPYNRDNTPNSYTIEQLQSRIKEIESL